MAKLRKGSKLICRPCGTEVVITNAGIARAVLWCCDKTMKPKSKAKKKVQPKRGAVKKKTVKRKTKKKK